MARAEKLHNNLFVSIAVMHCLVFIPTNPLDWHTIEAWKTHFSVVALSQAIKAISPDDKK